MAAKFELWVDEDARFRFQLLADDGAVMLTSVAFDTEDDAIAGIWSIRETATTARVVDLTGQAPLSQPAS